MRKIKKMKIKNRRKHSWWILKLVSIILLFSFSFCLTLRYFSKNIDNQKFLNLLIHNGNSYLEKNKKSHFFSNLITLITDSDISKPTSLLNIYYPKKELVTSSDEEQDLETLPSSNYVKDPYENKTPINNPLVYLYNTHQSEEYSSTNLESYNINPTVMMTSYILREKLNKNDIPTIVEENDVTEFLRTNNWNYASSYKVTRLLMEDAYSKNQSLQYFIDLHRDSVKKNISSVTIENKNYAKILFIVGLENKNYAKNLEITKSLNDKFNEKYPGLSRGIYKKQGVGVNGVYNQDFHPNTILIEVGGQENTIDEVFNTCEAISNVLTEYIKEVSNEE